MNKTNIDYIDRTMIIFCAKCRIEMRCEQYKAGADFGEGQVYPGGIFQCKYCRAETLITDAKPIHDPYYRKRHQYIPIDKICQRRHFFF